MESQGIVLNESENIPSDPYTIRRVQAQQTHIIPYDHNLQLERFLALDRQVHTHIHSCMFTHKWIHSFSLIISLLSPGAAFLCALGRHRLSLREKRPVTLHYYLVDDSVDICEHHEANSGRDPFPVLLSRQKIPKHIKSTCGETINTQISTQKKNWLNCVAFCVYRSLDKLNQGIPNFCVSQTP